MRLERENGAEVRAWVLSYGVRLWLVTAVALGGGSRVRVVCGRVWRCLEGEVSRLRRAVRWLMVEVKE